MIKGIEVKGLMELKKALSPERYKKIATRTLNKLGPQAKTAINREVRNIYNIKRERLDAGFYMKRATWEDITILLRYKGKTPGLQNYDARQTRKGVTVKIRKDRGRKTAKGAFMPKKIIGVYKREGEERLPIKRLYGPDLPGMVNTVGYDVAQRVIDEKADRILTHEFEYEMKKK